MTTLREAAAFVAAAFYKVRAEKAQQDPTKKWMIDAKFVPKTPSKWMQKVPPNHPLRETGAKYMVELTFGIAVMHAVNLNATELAALGAFVDDHCSIYHHNRCLKDGRPLRCRRSMATMPRARGCQPT